MLYTAITLEPGTVAIPTIPTELELKMMLVDIILVVVIVDALILVT